MEPIIGRVSDGRSFLNGVPVCLLDPTTDTPIAETRTAPRPGGAATAGNADGWFALAPQGLAPGAPIRVVVEAEGVRQATHDTTMPEPGRKLQLALTLPNMVPGGMPGPDSVHEPDAFACAACLLNGIDMRALAKANPQLESAARARLARHDPALLQRLIDGKLTPADVQDAAAMIARKRLGRAVGREELADMLARLLPRDDDNTLPGAAGNWRQFTLGRIRVDYAIAGDDALTPDQLAPPGPGESFTPPQGAPVALAADAPAFVQKVAAIGQAALTHFTTVCGLRDPGPQRIRLCVVTAGSLVPYGMTRPAWDHVRINRINDLAENQGTVPHELFHRIQYAYNPSSDDRPELHRAIREGGAVLAEDSFDPATNRYVHRARAYLSEPWRPMALPGDAGPRFSYASALFWRYLEESEPGGLRGRNRDAAGNVRLGAMKGVLEATATVLADGSANPDGGYTVAVLRRGLVGDQRFDTWTRLGDDDLTVACADTLYGNWLVANCLMKDAERVSDRRFRYAEATHQAAPIRAHGRNRALEATRLIDLGRPILTGDAPRLRPGVRLEFPPLVERGFPWAARYIRLGAEGLVQVRVKASAVPADRLLQLVRLSPDGTLLLLREECDEQGEASLVAAASRDDLLFAVLATREQRVPAVLSAELVADAPVPFITPWNAAPGQAHEADPAETSWTWQSPDITAAAVPERLRAGSPVRLTVRVRNRGTAPAAAFRVRLDCGRAQMMAVSCTLAPAGGPSGTAAVARSGPVGPGDSAVVPIDWLPPEDAPAADWIIRATAEADGAPCRAVALTRLAAFADTDGWARPPTI